MADVTVTLDSQTALVLFECLARWDHGQEPLALNDAAEEYAMLQVMARLESSLVAPLRADYLDALARAREDLLRRVGAD
jgi:hypothetical protein